MAHDTLNARSEFGKTFTVAMWLIGLAAAVQVIAVGWALMTRPVPPRPQANAAAPPPADTGHSHTSPLPASAAKGNTELAVPPITPGSTGEIPGFSALPPMPALIDPDDAPPPKPAPANPAAGGGGHSESAPGSAGVIATGPAPPPAPPPDTSGGNPLPAPRFDGPKAPPPLTTALSQAALDSPPEIAIPDPEIGRLVDDGAEKRASGNMQGALDDLRKAESILPDHPRILAEIAATYDGLGLTARSSLYWEKVRDLGPEAGGAWFGIAVGELTGERGSDPTARRVLKLGQVAAAHDQTVTEGERVVLSVTVEADPAMRPNAAEMEMLVYFYDLVDGERAEASTADTSQNFISKPYNWLTDGEETIEVIYHQPEFTEEQIRDLGVRKYHGYIIELYYHGELQDTAVFPPDLKGIDPDAPPSPLTEPAIGPENSLFPTVPNDNDDA